MPSELYGALVSFPVSNLKYEEKEGRQKDEMGGKAEEMLTKSEQGGNFVNVPSMYSPEHVRAWKVVTDAVHVKGGYMACQLWHVGLPSPLLYSVTKTIRLDVSQSPTNSVAVLL